MTYLIINLTIADLFVVTASRPMHIYHIMTFERGSGLGWGNFVVHVNNALVVDVIPFALTKG